MRTVLSFVLILIGALASNAQINATVYPSETYEMETFSDFGMQGCPKFFNKFFTTGLAQQLAFSVYNKSYDDVSLSFTCENPADGFKYHDSFFARAYRQSDRYEYISTGMLNYSYFWDTELIIHFPAGYNFEAYWIYQVRNL